MDIEAITKLRTDIDDIDVTLVKLLNQRAEIAKRIGEAKGDAPVYDPAREKMVLERLTGLNDGPLPKGAIEDIFAGIITACREIQLQ